MNTTAPTLAPPAKKPKTIFDLLDAPDTAKKFQHVLSGYITPEKMLRLSVNAIRKTPRLLECNPYTVFGALMTAASLDLEPNTVLGQAYLIPYGKNMPVKDESGNIVKDPNTGKWLWQKIYECNFQIGYRGFVDLAYRSPRLVKLEAEAIHAKDRFEHQKGSDSFLRYTKAMADRGDLIGAFCYMEAQSEHGARADIATILPLDEIHKIRSRSETYRSLTKGVNEAKDDNAKAKAAALLADTPWVLWEDDMVAKSAIKKAVKQFPLSRKMAAAAEIDSFSDSAILDLSSMADPDLAKSVSEGEDMPNLIEHTPEQQMEMVKPTQKEGEKVEAKKPAAKKAEAKTSINRETGEITDDSDPGFDPGQSQQQPANQFNFPE